MQRTTLLEIGKIEVVTTSYGGIYDDLSFNWIEPSNYCMFPDEEVEIYVDREQAAKLIEVLTKHFDL